MAPSSSFFRFSLLASAFLVAVSFSPAVASAGDEGISRLDFDASGGTLTVETSDASLFGVLGELKSRHGIDVRVQGNTEDRRVSVNLAGKPLYEVLDALMGQTKYHVKMGVDVPQPRKNTGHQTGAKGGGTNGRPAMPAGGRRGPDDRSKSGMAAADRPQRHQATGGGGGMGGAGAIPGGPHTPDESSGEVAAPPATGKKYARLHFRITPQGGAELLSITEISGPYVPETETYGGDFIHAVSVGGQVQAVGSMRDPLVGESLSEDEGKGHVSVPVHDGIFSITLPPALVTRGKLSQAAVEFYHHPQDVDRPEKLSVADFKNLKAAGRFRKVGRSVDKDKLLRAFDARQKR